MNILPKKSWHVLSKKNIDRVRKDEAEAKAQEEEKQRRVEIAEREARLELMRRRVRQREGYDDDDDGNAVEPTSKESQPPPDEPTQHINFFQDVKKGVGLQSTNEEHEAEQKADQEKLEKRIGLLNYLVDKDKSEDPWYVRHKSSEESAKSRRRKERMDPLNDMKHFIEAKRKCTEQTPDRPPLLSSASAYKSLSSSSRTERRQLIETVMEDKGKSKKHKKHKSKSKSKEKEKELEEMRRKRRQREEAERARTEAMLRQHYGEGGGQEKTTSGPQMVEEMPGRYNSQFNPHLARHSH